MKKRTIQKSHVSVPMQLLKVLENSQFFVVYPDFVSVHCDFQQNYAHFFDNATKYMKHAARAYFQQFFSETYGNVEVNTESKEVAGAQVSELKSRIWGN